MVNFSAPCTLGDIIYDNLASAWKVYSVQFYEKNIALKCTSCEGKGNKTFLVGKKSIGKTIFIGENAEKDAWKAFKKLTDTTPDFRTPDEDFENFKN